MNAFLTFLSDTLKTTPLPMGSEASSALGVHAPKEIEGGWGLRVLQGICQDHGLFPQLCSRGFSAHLRRNPSKFIFPDKKHLFSYLDLGDSLYLNEQGLFDLSVQDHHCQQRYQTFLKNETPHPSDAFEFKLWCHIFLDNGGPKESLPQEYEAWQHKFEKAWLESILNPTSTPKSTCCL